MDRLLTGLAALGNGLLMFVLEAGGDLLVGALAGFLISHVLRHIDDPVVEITITLLSAYGFYWVADMLRLSAIVAIIVTALILGNYGRAIGMSERSRTDADTFWRMLAFLGNALIFLLMGVQIHPFARQLLAGPALATWLVASCGDRRGLTRALCPRAGAHPPFVGELTTQRWATHPDPTSQAASASRLAVDRVLEWAAWGALAHPSARVAAGRAFARGAGCVHHCRRPVHASHPGVEHPLGLAAVAHVPTPAVSF